MRKLLPWPYKTNCYDYNSPSSLFESREYCYLDVMRKLELKYCKVNKYWTVDTKKQGNVSHCIKPDYKYLNKICKVNCLDVKMEYKIIAESNMKRPGMSAIIIADIETIDQRIYLTYLPELTKLEFFSRFGGLMGLWLGLSIYEFILKICRILKKLILKFIISRNILRIIFQRIEIFLKFIIITMMILNLKLLVYEFFSGYKITKINIIDEIDLPQNNISENIFSSNRKLFELLQNYFKKSFEN